MGGVVGKDMSRLCLLRKIIMGNVQDKVTVLPAHMTLMFILPTYSRWSETKYTETRARIIKFKMLSIKVK